MSSPHPLPTRRHFFMQAGAAGLGLMASSATSRALPPSEQVRVAMIGIGGQGLSNLRKLLANVVAVCDVDSARLAGAKKLVEATKGQTCDAVGDFRRLLDRKDIDAVAISTPDHWHALPTVLACQAGKDVYTEKPLSLTVLEGQTMVTAARKDKRIVQTGSQQRSDDKFRLACELVRSGALGTLKAVKVGLPGVNFKGPAVPDSTPPAELDYDFWLGPAPKKPYNGRHVHYDFRFFWDYSGGQLTNWGAHHLDIVQWALGMDESGPVSIEGTPKYHPERWYEVPESFDLVYTYTSGLPVLCGQKHRGGVTFEGEKGSLWVNRGKIESTPADILKKPQVTEQLYVSKNHHANWLECIKTRKAPICDVGIGHRSATVCHLGNIALRTGRKITWDPARETIVADSEAAAMLSRPYRSPWVLPELG
jgi:predicted dehydrogenase